MWLSITFIFLSKWRVLSFNALHILIFYIVIIVIFRLKLYRPEFAAQIQDRECLHSEIEQTQQNLSRGMHTFSYSTRTTSKCLISILCFFYAMIEFGLPLGCLWLKFFFIIFYLFIFSDIAFC